jgi:hypothetical protein
MMNNRKIKELWQVAFDMAHSEWDKGPDLSMSRLTDLTIEMYTELVVKECISLSDKYASGGAGSDWEVGYLACAEALSEEFKEHFGITS